MPPKDPSALFPVTFCASQQARVRVLSPGNVFQGRPPSSQWEEGSFWEWWHGRGTRKCLDWAYHEGQWFPWEAETMFCTGAPRQQCQSNLNPQQRTEPERNQFQPLAGFQPFNPDTSLTGVSFLEWSGPPITQLQRLSSLQVKPGKNKWYRAK